MSTSESPAPKSRGRHRPNRSGNPATAITLPHNARTQQPTVNYSSPQPSTTPSNAQQVPRTMTHQPKGIVTPPQSPSKFQQNQSPANGSSTAAKKKRKQKPRPKDVSTDLYQNNFPGYESPALSSSNDESSGGHSSPTRGGVLNTPTKAYAGPNFHSSPAPSSLPVPSWFSKSVPATPSAGSSLQALLELNGEDNTISQSLEEESHLQKLFRADKEEKARQARPAAGERTQSMQESSTNTFNQNAPHSPIQPRRRNSPDMLSSGGLFAMDNLGSAAKSAEQNIFNTPAKPPAQEARQKAAALISFLNEPSQSPQLPLVHNANDTQGTPTRPQAPQRRAQFAARPLVQTPIQTPTQTPTKKAIAPVFNSSPERKTSAPVTPARRKPHYTLQTQATPPPRRYAARDEATTDSVLKVNEMEEYLRRILNLEARGIATPAAAS